MAAGRPTGDHETVVKYFVQIGGEGFEIDLEEQGKALIATLGDRKLAVDLEMVVEPSLYSLLVDNRSHEVLVEEHEGQYSVLIAGELYHVKVQDEWARRLARVRQREKTQEGELPIKAPMPGVVTAVEVKAGEEVARGKGLLILTAMKMENEIKAPRAGVVKAISVAEGQTVEQGRTLLLLG